MSEPCDESSSALNDSLRPTLGELNEPIQEDWNFEKLGVARLEWMLEGALRTMTKKEFAEAAKCEDLLLTRLLRKPEDRKRPKRLSRHLLRRLADPLADSLYSQDENEGLDNGQAVEIDLNLHRGQLPGHVFRFQSEERTRHLLATIRDLIDTTCRSAQEPGRGWLDVDYWLEQMSDSARNWKAVEYFAATWRLTGEWPQVHKLWRIIEDRWSSMDDVQRGFAMILRSQTLVVRGLTQDALALLEAAKSLFHEEAKEPLESPTRAIRFLLHATRGNVYREAGRVSEAIDAYEWAGKYAATPGEHLRLRRKKFNSYLRSAQSPPDGWVKDQYCPYRHK